MELATAKKLHESGMAEKILLIGVDTLSQNHEFGATGRPACFSETRGSRGIGQP